MADILIRGMDKPFNCFACDLSRLSGERLFCCVTKDEVLRYKIASDCPIHELPEHGEWIEDRMDYRCSVCGKTVKDEIIYMLEPYQFPAFCPYCGAKLEPPKEETE